MKLIQFLRFEKAQVLVLVLFVLAITPVMSSNPAAIDTSVTIATFTIIAISLALSYGLGGMLSFAQATFAAIGAYATAILTTKLGVSPLIGLPVAILVPMILAYLLSRLIVRLSPLALGLATLALSQLIELLLDEGGHFTGGYVGISSIAELIPASNWLWLHLLGWGIVAVVLLAAVRLRNSNTGRAIKAVSIDDTLAQGVGIRPVKELTMLFTVSGGIAGLAGWFYAHSRTYLAPTSLSLELSFMVAIAVIVGGRRTLLGPVLGTAMIVILRDVLPGAETHGMFYGAALVVTLLLFPDGILGTDWKAISRRLGGRNAASRVVEAPAE